mmetsp:Transcript_1145/g.3700  ORF Transcript_1145/g.3700 Transcript_1145/m.3700 type:complete len:262 (+) Transcript_1145:339-1124(+)
MPAGLPGLHACRSAPGLATPRLVGTLARRGRSAPRNRPTHCYPSRQASGGNWPPRRARPRWSRRAAPPLPERCARCWSGTRSCWWDCPGRRPGSPARAPPPPIRPGWRGPPRTERRPPSAAPCCRRACSPGARTGAPGIQSSAAACPLAPARGPWRDGNSTPAQRLATGPQGRARAAEQRRHLRAAQPPWPGAGRCARKPRSARARGRLPEARRRSGRPQAGTGPASAAACPRPGPPRACTGRWPPRCTGAGGRSSRAGRK